MSFDHEVVTSDETREIIGEMLGGGDYDDRFFRIAIRPSKYMPRQALTTPNGTKCGHDRMLEDFERSWLKGHGVRRTRRKTTK
jgi:hypothetical protein